jgi:hypothetical protein
MSTASLAPLSLVEPSPSVELPVAQRARFGIEPVQGRHDLAFHPLFTDAALAGLLDRFPREHLQAHCSGDDPARLGDNHRVDLGRFTGAQLLDAVRHGRLWLNLTRIDRVEPEYRALINQLYERLMMVLPDFAPEASQGTLLISSPTAQVYYHADASPSVLWHLRGRKRIWVYPDHDARYLHPEHLEDIFAGARHEYLPYQPGFDTAAIVQDLRPGHWLAWPHNAPHRVCNLDGLNVSLSTEHHTADSRRRFRVQVANRFLRTRFGLRNLSIASTGPLANVKTLAQRVARKLGLDPVTLHGQAATRRLVLPADADIPVVDGRRLRDGYEGPA